MSCADRSVALVTGSAALGAAVIPALEKEGFSTHSALSDAPYGLEPVRAALPARSLDCYVQLPTTTLDHDGTVSVAGLRALVANALLARLDTLAVVAHLLAPGARVVIVAGDRAGTIRDTDLGLPDISCRLAEAVLAGNGMGNHHTSVIGHDRTAADIAAVARGQADGTRRPPLAALAAASPHLGFAEWRHEIISLTTELDDGQWPVEFA